jgi:uncharacterized protein YecT (DUF1311 family)
MMKKYIVSFALLILSISAAQAQSQYSSEYNQCMDKAAGVTADVITCIGTEVTQQDKKLNANYKTLKASLNANRQKQLLEVQRVWLQYREANCKFYDDPEGGSMQRILANDCFLRMTAERAEELKTLQPMSY